MHPLRERACEELLQHPFLATPEPEPEKPRSPRPRRPRQFKLPPRFPLLTKKFYECWCNHRKQLIMSKHKVDDSPPELFPELYLKPRRLDFYARQLEETMNVNKELLKRINVIQRTGGFVDCWNPERPNNYNKLLCQHRQNVLDEIQKANFYFYTRLLIARSEQPTTKEFDRFWKSTKRKLILGASVSMDIGVLNGSKIGKIIIELFIDITPKTCLLFLSLVRGDEAGHAYTGTRFFRIVPGIYCRGGDVVKDNGFGSFIPKGLEDPMVSENFELSHTVPGVLSMAVTHDNEVYGQFNILFKPLPQFDGKHVVFGRIISGPALALERISALGLPLGTTTTDCTIRSCGIFSRNGNFREGRPNTIKFPPRGKKKT